jgi:hypothetical protein
MHCDDQSHPTRQGKDRKRQLLVSVSMDDVESASSKPAPRIEIQSQERAIVLQNNSDANAELPKLVGQLAFVEKQHLYLQLRMAHGSLNEKAQHPLSAAPSITGSHVHNPYVHASLIQNSNGTCPAKLSRRQ